MARVVSPSLLVWVEMTSEEHPRIVPDSYQPDIGRKIARIFAKRQKEGLTLRQFYQEHYAVLGFSSEEMAEVYLRHVRNGCIYGSSSSVSVQREQNVRRLETLLYLLGVPEDNSIIDRLDELDERFEYPPEER